MSAITFGDLLRRAREKKGLTQGELAQAASSSRQTINNLERGRYQVMLQTAYLLASVLEVKVDDLCPDSWRSITYPLRSIGRRRLIAERKVGRVSGADTPAGGDAN